MKHIDKCGCYESTGLVDPRCKRLRLAVTKRNEFLKRNDITKCYCDIYPNHPDVWNYWTDGSKTCVYCGREEKKMNLKSLTCEPMTQNTESESLSMIEDEAKLSHIACFGEHCYGDDDNCS